MIDQGAMKTQTLNKMQTLANGDGLYETKVIESGTNRFV